jgi:hypothetical protein
MTNSEIISGVCGILLVILLIYLLTILLGKMEVDISKSSEILHPNPNPHTVPSIRVARTHAENMRILADTILRTEKAINSGSVGKNYCEWCHGYTIDDERGQCSGCGASRVGSK